MPTAAEYSEVEKGHLGEGGSGSVKKVKRKSDGKLLACKTIFVPNAGRDTRELRARIHKEHEILLRLEHDHIVKYEGIRWESVTGYGDMANLYMELCDGESLQTWLNTHRPPNENSVRAWIPEISIWNISKQVASALAYCHYGVSIADLEEYITNPDQLLTRKPGWSTVLHRDVKPANIMMCGDGETVKLVDFGFSFVVQKGRDPQTFGGSEGFKAPEIKQQTKPNPWSEASDIYSFGCTLYALCLLDPPYDREAVDILPPRYSLVLSELVFECMALADGRPSLLTIYRTSVNCYKDPPISQKEEKESRINFVSFNNQGLVQNQAGTQVIYGNVIFSDQTWPPAA